MNEEKIKFNKRIGAAIRLARKSHGMSMSDLIQEANLPIMRPIPPTMHEEMANDQYYTKCARL